MILENDSASEIVDANSNNSIEKKESPIHENNSNNTISDPKANPMMVSGNSNLEKLKEKAKNSIAKNTNSDYKKSLEEKNNPNQKNSSKDAIASTTKAISKTNQNSQNKIKDKSEIDALLKSTETNSAVVDINTKEKGVFEQENSETETNSSEDTTNKKEKEEDVNAIENAIAEAENTEEKEEEEEKSNRWSVSPIVAPVYFSSLGKEGSPLDNQFVENTKEPEINMSYGINGSYAVNKKFKIRAGIHKVQLGYKTNDVLIFENTNPIASANRQIANVNLVDSMSSHSIYSARNFKFDNAPATLFTKEQGSLDQQLGFIEVPIEMEYNVIEHKIGIKSYRWF